MFIHTLTFLNISKSSPSKSYLAYRIPHLCFIIQSSCIHVLLEMQYVRGPIMLHSLFHPTLTRQIVPALSAFPFKALSAVWKVNQSKYYLFPLSLFSPSTSSHWLGLIQKIPLRSACWLVQSLKCFFFTASSTCPQPGFFIIETGPGDSSHYVKVAASI